ncbi:MAG: DUF433 domain-containing protein [Nitrospirota bacterium]
MNLAVKQVKHPYITRDKKVRGGVPIIAGTGIRVLDIAIRYEVMGMSPEDIITALPHLNLSQVHDALSYYYEHKSDIDKEWKSAIKEADSMRKAYPSVLEKKIGKIKDIHR